MDFNSPSDASTSSRHLDATSNSRHEPTETPGQAAMFGQLEASRIAKGKERSSTGIGGEGAADFNFDDPFFVNLIAQGTNADGTPKRPMNAFMIYAKRRRPELSTENPTLRTGDISKVLSKEWNVMPKARKQLYLNLAKKLKDEFNLRYPTYVYTRRPNNSRRRRRGTLQGGDEEGEGDPIELDDGSGRSFRDGPDTSPENEPENIPAMEGTQFPDPLSSVRLLDYASLIKHGELVTSTDALGLSRPVHSRPSPPSRNIGDIASTSQPRPSARGPAPSDTNVPRYKPLTPQFSANRVMKEPSLALDAQLLAGMHRRPIEPPTLHHPKPVQSLPQRKSLDASIDAKALAGRSGRSLSAAATAPPTPFPSQLDPSAYFPLDLTHLPSTNNSHTLSHLDPLSFGLLNPGTSTTGSGLPGSNVFSISDSSSDGRSSLGSSHTPSLLPKSLKSPSPHSGVEGHHAYLLPPAGSTFTLAGAGTNPTPGPSGFQASENHPDLMESVPSLGPTATASSSTSFNLNTTRANPDWLLERFPFETALSSRQDFNPASEELLRQEQNKALAQSFDLALHGSHISRPKTSPRAEPRSSLTHTPPVSVTPFESALLGAFQRHQANAPTVDHRQPSAGSQGQKYERDSRSWPRSNG